MDQEQRSTGCHYMSGRTEKWVVMGYFSVKTEFRRACQNTRNYNQWPGNSSRAFSDNLGVCGILKKKPSNDNSREEPGLICNSIDG